MKAFNKMISLVLVLVLGWSVALPSYATEDIVFQELTALGKDAENFARMLTNDFTAAAVVYGTGEPSIWKKQNDVAEFMAKNGYLDGDVGEAIELPLRWNSEYTDWYNPFAARFDSLEKWDEEVLRYFTSDFLGLIRDPYSRVQEYEGKTYCSTMNRFCYFYINWENCVLTELTEEHAEITAEIFLEDEELHRGYATVEYEKTEDGWRVSGGGYFDFEYFGKEDAISQDPPKTGDPTAAYALIFTLAALPLAGFGVYEWKKRRRAV